MAIDMGSAEKVKAGVGVSSEIIDDSSALGFSYLPGTPGNGTNGWNIGYGGQGYSNQVSFIRESSNPGTPVASATWTPQKLIAGDARVYLHWTTHSNRATNATYSITDKTGSTTSIVVNQELLADQATLGSSGQSSDWMYVGTYQMDSVGTAQVQLTNVCANQYVIADAVKFQIDQYPSASTFSEPLDFVNKEKHDLDGGVKVSWDASADPDGDDTVSYLVNLYNSDPDLAAVAPIDTYLDLTNNLAKTFTVSADGQYWLTLNVISIDSNGAELYNEETDDVTFVLDRTPPVAAAGVVGDYADGSVTLNWNAVADAVSYDVHRYASPDEVIANVLAPSTSFVDNNPGSGDIHYYIVSKDAAGNVSAKSGEYNVDLSQIAAPTNLVAVDGDGEATLTWDSVVNASSYDVYYKKSSEATYIGPVNVSTNSTTIMNLENGSSYDFLVRSVSATGIVSANASTSVQLQSVIEVTVASAPVVVQEVSIAPEQVQAEEDVETIEEVLDEDGKILGEDEEAAEDDDINWTPWIILFILIILAGAATGGYFYWFADEDEVETKVREEKKPAKSSAPKKSNKNKGSSKRRW